VLFGGYPVIGAVSFVRVLPWPQNGALSASHKAPDHHERVAESLLITAIWRRFLALPRRFSGQQKDLACGGAQSGKLRVVVALFRDISFPRRRFFRAHARTHAIGLRAICVIGRPSYSWPRSYVQSRANKRRRPRAWCLITGGGY